jgi:hypothetical protein
MIQYLWTVTPTRAGAGDLVKLLRIKASDLLTETPSNLDVSPTAAA